MAHLVRLVAVRGDLSTVHGGRGRTGVPYKRRAGHLAVPDKVLAGAAGYRTESLGWMCLYRTRWGCTVRRMGANRSGQKRVEVWVDEAAYAQALAGKPRGWLSLQVRLLIERENAEQGEPTLIDFGATGENPAIPLKVTQGGNPAKHLFRRGEVYAEVRQGGNVTRTYLCACGCGEIR